MLAGSGSTILFNHTGDNEMVSLRFRLKGTKMLAAEESFDAGGHHYVAGTFILPNAPRSSVERVAAELGLKGEAVESAPSVK